MTGIELAAEMRNRIAQHGGDDVARAAKVILIEMADVIGPEFGDNPRPVIDDALALAGVEQRVGSAVASFDATGITLQDGSRIDAATVVVTVGLRANGLTAQIPGERDDLGRLTVGDDLKVAGLNNVYATGDVARTRVDEAGNVALMSCQHARTMGKYAGLNVVRDLTGEAPRPYRQPDYTHLSRSREFRCRFHHGLGSRGPDHRRRSQAAQADDQHSVDLSAQRRHGRGVCRDAHRRAGAVAPS